jgi:hypothetical protein
MRVASESERVRGSLSAPRLTTISTHSLALPLTPTLSPREREQRFLSSFETAAARPPQDEVFLKERTSS